jgi:hypothetical protein
MRLEGSPCKYGKQEDEAGDAWQKVYGESMSIVVMIPESIVCLRLCSFLLFSKKDVHYCILDLV